MNDRVMPGRPGAPVSVTVPPWEVTERTRLAGSQVRRWTLKLAVLLLMAAIAVSMLPAGVGGAAPGDTVLISLESDGSDGGSHAAPYPLDMSADGRYVVYSYNHVFVPNVSQADERMLWDRTTGAREIVSYPPGSADPNMGWGPTAVSDNGRYVAMAHFSEDLGFRYDRQTGESIMFNIANDGSEPTSIYGTSPAEALSMSANGNRIAFVSNAENMVAGDTNGIDDVFVRDVAAGATARASVDPSGNQFHSDGVNKAAISSNGRYVVFAIGPNVWRRDLQAGVTDRVSPDPIQISATGYDDVAVSADGRFVVYSANGDELPGAWHDDGQVWRRDMNKSVATGTTLVTRNPDGEPIAGGSASTPFGLSVSADGRHVSFISSSTELVPETRQLPYGIPNQVYVRDVSLGVTTLVTVGTGSDGVGDGHAKGNTVLSNDGRWIAYASDATNLVGAPSPIQEEVVAGTDAFQTELGVVAAPLFEDVSRTHTFFADIEWLANSGITRGCNPPTNTEFCPDDEVTRGQMAAFLHRALPDLLLGPNVPFTDTVGNTFEADISWLARAGVTKGCNPPINDRYCPDDPVTRGQMAAFLVRALGLTDSSGTDFIDDNGSVFETDIEKLAAAGVTRGCNPPVNDRFCPNDFVTRSQMAAFLRRALG